MKKDFVINADTTKALMKIGEMINNVPNINLNNLIADETILIIVDLINGFAIKGALSSPRVGELINPIANFILKAKEAGIKTMAFKDAHTKNSKEFDSFPEHCLDGTYESEIVEEVNKLGIDIIVPKNSTNGFVARDFEELKEEILSKYKNFIIVGDCTDICVIQFAQTLKAYFNEYDFEKRIIVPTTLVDTFEFDMHDATLTNVMSLYLMKSMGIEIVKEIV
ncbi:isochorismatase family cysteine hydrolase [Wukongibacter baidiensis]|uniref:cysteine hydrolase family protein n=1 Tax=Wukongibacter baidiensis TaxID=1723361 RepID=UPI003D7FB350